MLQSALVPILRARKPFLDLAPGFPSLFNFRILRYISLGIRLGFCTYRVCKGTSADKAIGETIAKSIADTLSSPFDSIVSKGFACSRIHSNRTLLDLNIQELERNHSRIIRPVHIMYHDANKAKKHIDVHIGRTSLIYRITGKPVEKKIRFNSTGVLTQESKDALLEHLRSEISNHSRVAQNLDHSLSNARCSWLVGDSGISGYGSGLTRQPIAIFDSEFYHHKVRTSEHMYVPKLFGDNGTYLYKIYNGETPILIWGKLLPQTVSFQDRLHLKLIQEKDLRKFVDKIDPSTNTRKLDGASTYFHSNGEGFKFFSPRESVTTHQKIEYTFKIPELAEKEHESHPVGMGELLFWKRTLFGRLLPFNIKGPEGICWTYLSAPEIGGILNSNEIRPRNIYPEVAIYRIDKWYGKNVYGENFWSNRLKQLVLFFDLSGYWSIVPLCNPVMNLRTKRYEGFVATSKDSSIIDGYKIKFWGDETDMLIESVNLSISAKNRIAGTVTCKFNDKLYDFGPGQIGDNQLCIDIMKHKNRYIGRTAKVISRIGHIGRAAIIDTIHLDK